MLTLHANDLFVTSFSDIIAHEHILYAYSVFY